MIPRMPQPETQNRKHDFFSKQWRRKSILLGLGIHFSLWWALAVWYWTSNMHWQWSSVAWDTLVAPVVLGIVDLPVHGFGKLFGVAGLLVSACLLGFTVRSATNRKRGAVLLAHMSVALYWFSSFLLIGIGI
jgi:hypothetical protein